MAVMRAVQKSVPMSGLSTKGNSGGRSRPKTTPRTTVIATKAGRNAM